MYRSVLKLLMLICIERNKVCKAYLAQANRSGVPCPFLVPTPARGNQKIKLRITFLGFTRNLSVTLRQWHANVGMQKHRAGGASKQSGPIPACGNQKTF